MGGQRPPWAGGGTAGGICCNFRFSTFFSRETGGSKKGIPPWRDKGAASATSCYSAFLCLPSFLAETRGSKKGIPPWRDKGAANATSRYSAFLCLLAFLAETRGIQEGYPSLAGQGRGKRHVPLLRFSLPTCFSRRNTGDPRGISPLGGTRPPSAARPVTPLFFAYFLFS